MKEQELTCDICEIGNYHTAICVGWDDENMVIAITQEQALNSNLKTIYGVTINSIIENFGNVWVSDLGGLRASRPIKDYMSYEG